MKVAVFICQLGLLLVTASRDADDVFSHKDWQEDECRRILREAKDSTIQAQTPPKLNGHWTSSKCETRPGPEFVLRKYIFRRNTFYAQLFYYSDEYCTRASHYLSARGTVKPSRKSWRTPGAYESRFSVTDISVIPYSYEKSDYFQSILQRYCKLANVNILLPYQKVKVLQFTKYDKHDLNKDTNTKNDFDCSKMFNFTMNELQLVRTEKRLTNSFRDTWETELLLGDISTNMKFRRQHRPTYYQTALKKSKTTGCDVCRKLVSANQRMPPVLRNDNVTDVALHGDWVSDRCETRPNGQYLTRHLTFLSSGTSWQGVFTFYKDALCTEPHFNLDVKGTYVKRSKSKIIHSADNYAFRTLRLKVTPLDFQMVQYLNSYEGNKCGKSKAWKLRVTQDVTNTQGCETLGVDLPNLEYELLKTEYNNKHSYLYVGQRTSDFVTMSDPKNRPTSFQRPLVKCGTSNEISSSFKEPEVPKQPEVHTSYIVQSFHVGNTGTCARSTVLTIFTVLSSIMLLI